MAKSLRWINTIAFAAMIIINVLAETLPIGGLTTGQVSGQYGNVFTPAGFTFGIWGVIYLMLAAFVIYHLIVRSPEADELIEDIGYMFAIGCVVNSLWLVVWHFDLLVLSSILMIVLFIINMTVFARVLGSRLHSEMFGVYSGWITIAMVANFYAMAVGLGANGRSSTALVLAVIIMAMSTLIGIAVTILSGTFGFGLAMIWAFVGLAAGNLGTDGIKNTLVVAVLIHVILLAAVEAIAVIYEMDSRSRRGGDFSATIFRG